MEELINQGEVLKEYVPPKYILKLTKETTDNINRVMRLLREACEINSKGVFSVSGSFDDSCFDVDVYKDKEVVFTSSLCFSGDYYNLDLTEEVFGSILSKGEIIYPDWHEQ